MALLIAVSPMLLFADSGAIGGGGIDWLKPSGGAYPRINPGERVWIKVSLNRQRVDIMEGERKAYTMVASTGLDSPADDRTPVGTFYVQRERGPSFYSAKVGEGARYWVSWLHHGEYLFHSVPTDKKGNIIASEAGKLGSKASHGCIRLSLSDAKWIYENIKYGAKVVIGP
jgi:lipoprotein-anchoring transpeptidase ErfK/SrfK